LLGSRAEPRAPAIADTSVPDPSLHEAVAAAPSVETSGEKPVRAERKARRVEPEPIEVESGVLISDYIDRLDAIQREADSESAKVPPASDSARLRETAVPDNPYQDD